MGSILRTHTENASNSTPQVVQTAATSTYPLPSTIKIPQNPNRNAPSQKHQFNEYLLFENEFHGDTYVSAHLQRLQHALIDSPNIHGDRKHVTFVAIEFCFHPSFEHDHRFRNCIIEVTASREAEGFGAGSKVEMLRFIKYAPHLAFGRISSESLKWNFQLGAKLGVTQGPVDVSVNPSGSYERDRTVGTMMKIQGTTRSLSKKDIPSNAVTTHYPPNRHDTRDRKIVWSLEENDQQQSGVPREFTFVFLVEQPRVAGGHIEGDKIIGDISTVFKDLTIGIKVQPSVTGLGVDSISHDIQYTTIRGEVGQRFYEEDEYQLQDQQNSRKILPQIMDSPTALKDNAAAAVRKGSAFVKKQLTLSNTEGPHSASPTSAKSTTSPTNQPKAPTAPATTSTSDKDTTLATSVDGPATDSLAKVFKPIRASISGIDTKTLQRAKFSGPPASTETPEQEKFQKSRTVTIVSEKSLVPDPSSETRLFNFALMEGSFEDLIELPGNAVTSMQPTLPEPTSAH